MTKRKSSIGAKKIKYFVSFPKILVFSTMASVPKKKK